MHHLSVEPWSESSKWIEFLEGIQRITGSGLVRLDTNDPLKRKISDVVEDANYICNFEERSQSRWIFGEFSDRKTGFTITHYRALDMWHNSMQWSFYDWKYSDAGRETIAAIFTLTNEILLPFYAFCDRPELFPRKNILSGTLNISEELLGIAWMTYLNSTYVDYFGADKFQHIPGSTFDANGAVSILLGNDPDSVSVQAREQAASVLGKDSFVDPSNTFRWHKTPGEYALTLRQLKDRSTAQ